MNEYGSNPIKIKAFPILKKKNLNPQQALGVLFCGLVGLRAEGRKAAVYSQGRHAVDRPKVDNGLSTLEPSCLHARGSARQRPACLRVCSRGGSSAGWSESQYSDPRNTNRRWGAYSAGTSRPPGSGSTPNPTPYKGTLLTRKCNPLAPYRRPMPRVLGVS